MWGGDSLHVAARKKAETAPSVQMENGKTPSRGPSPGSPGAIASLSRAYRRNVYPKKKKKIVLLDVLFEPEPGPLKRLS